jgi:glutathione reductase (NADPH)
VIQIYRGDMWMRGFDMDIRTHLADEYKKQGIDLRMNCNCTSMAKNAAGGITCTLTDGTVVDVDVAMFATGRKPRTSDLRCELAGVRLEDDGSVVVDEAFQ